MTGSSSIQRETRPRTTAESSTTMTLMGRSASGCPARAGVALFMVAPEPSMSGRDLDQPDLMKLGFDDVAIEGFHDVLVGARADRAGDMLDVVLRRAEDHFRPAAPLLLAQRDEEGDAV